MDWMWSEEKMRSPESLLNFFPEQKLRNDRGDMTMAIRSQGEWSSLHLLWMDQV